MLWQDKQKYFIEDLIEACNEALNEFNGMNKNTGERSSVKRRQIFDNIKYMESEVAVRYDYRFR